MLLHHPHPNEAQYKRLQDFLFRYIAAECGRLGMPVHLHTTSGGGGYFSIAGDNPLLLEPLFNDPRLRTPTSSSSTAAGPSSTRSAHSSRNPTSTSTSPSSPS